MSSPLVSPRPDSIDWAAINQEIKNKFPEKPGLSIDLSQIKKTESKPLSPRNIIRRLSLTHLSPRLEHEDPKKTKKTISSPSQLFPPPSSKKDMIPRRENSIQIHASKSPKNTLEQKNIAFKPTSYAMGELQISEINNLPNDIIRTFFGSDDFAKEDAKTYIPDELQKHKFIVNGNSILLNSNGEHNLQIQINFFTSFFSSMFSDENVCDIKQHVLKLVNERMVENNAIKTVAYFVNIGWRLKIFKFIKSEFEKLDNNKPNKALFVINSQDYDKIRDEDKTISFKISKDEITCTRTFVCEIFEKIVIKKDNSIPLTYDRESLPLATVYFKIKGKANGEKISNFLTIAAINIHQNGIKHKKAIFNCLKANKKDRKFYLIKAAIIS